MNEPLLSRAETAPPPRASTQIEALISNSPVAIVALDGNHRFVTANPAFERLFGYSPDDLLADDFDDMIAAPGMEEESRLLSRTVLEGNKVHVVTHRRRSDGTIIQVEISGIPLMEDGRLAGVYGLYQDLTERAKAADELRAMAHRVEAAQEHERRRIARHLHDSTSQELNALIGSLNRLQTLLAGQDDAVTDLVQQTRQIASQCSARIRGASGEICGKKPAEPMVSRLTHREREIMYLLANGSTSRQISLQLGISVRTVESHRTNLNAKCGFHTLADLVRFALREEADALPTVNFPDSRGETAISAYRS